MGAEKRLRTIAQEFDRRAAEHPYHRILYRRDQKDPPFLLNPEIGKFSWDAFYDLACEAATILNVIDPSVKDYESFVLWLIKNDQTYCPFRLALADPEQNRQLGGDWLSVGDNAFKSAAWAVTRCLGDLHDRIPAGERTIPMSYRRAARLMGKGKSQDAAEWLSASVKDGSIKCEHVSRQSHVFSKLDFPESAWQEILPK